MATETTETTTPKDLARRLWGPSEDDSRSAGARRIRQVARELFPDDAPGQGREWQLTPDQVAAIRTRV